MLVEMTIARQADTRNLLRSLGIRSETRKKTLLTVDWKYL